MVIEVVQVLGLSAVLGALGTWLSRTLARYWNVVNEPNPIVPQHVRPIAYFGGIGIALGLCGTLVAVAAQGGLLEHSVRSWLPLGVGAFLYLLLGLVDDLRPLRPVVKFSFQVGVALLVVALGLVLPLTGLLPLDTAVTALWIVAVVNAVNFTDVCDGLVAGLAVVWSLTFAFVVPPMAPVLLTIAGASMGCLLFNAPPASVFLGDAGSHLLGFCLAGATVHTVMTHGLWPGGAVAVTAGGVPLFELVFITVVRVRKGLPWWRGSPDHFSLRLQAAGWSRWRTDLVTWLSGAGLGVAAVVMLSGSRTVQTALLVTMLVAASGAARFLMRWEVPVER